MGLASGDYSGKVCHSQARLARLLQKHFNAPKTLQCLIYILTEIKYLVEAQCHIEYIIYKTPFRSCSNSIVMGDIYIS